MSKACLASRLDPLLRVLFKKFRGRYGASRMWVQLNKMGIQVSQSYVGKRMAVLALVARKRKKQVLTTQVKAEKDPPENVLSRRFNCTQLNQHWVGDISYFSYGKQAHGYLTVVLDLADRAVVGWCVSTGLSSEQTTIQALNMAVKRRKVTKLRLFHSDRGTQYDCAQFREVLRDLSATQSMSRVGNCWDNAVAESFFKTLKTELGSHFSDIAQAKNALFEFIERWYNTQRMHSSLGYRTPKEHHHFLLHSTNKSTAT